MLAPNLSMTQILWERAWQERREAVSALGALGIQNGSNVVLRYLLENGCPVDHLTGYDLCLTHDLDLIRVGMRRGVSILEPDGWASAFIRIGSRPLIRFFLEERDRIPGLAKDAVYALCTAIKESRLRAIALLRWAGVDPLGKAPRYDDWDEPESEWTGFPVLNLSYAEKPGEILKLLKLKPNVRQWFDLLRDMSCGRAEHIDDIMALVKDPMEVIRRHPARSEWLLRNALRSICWGWSWNSGPDERLAALCVKLIEAGVRLRWRDNSELNRCRRDFYRSNRKELCLRILKRAAELANDDSKEELVRLVDKPRMREIVIQNQRVPTSISASPHGTNPCVTLNLQPESSNRWLFENCAFGADRNEPAQISESLVQPRRLIASSPSGRKVTKCRSTTETSSPSNSAIFTIVAPRCAR